MDVTSLAAGLLEPIPANAALGIKVISAAEGCAEVSMPEAPDRANVVGSMHSSGLIALIDAASLAAVVAMSDERAPFEGIVPLGASAHLEFLAPARGELKRPLRARSPGEGSDHPPTRWSNRQGFCHDTRRDPRSRGLGGLPRRV